MTTNSDTWTLLRVLDWTKGYLAEKGVENARLETEWILCAILGLDRVGIYLNFDRPLNDDELAAIRGLVSRRARREPLQHLLGSQEFAGFDVLVSPSVLIPRHDTEVLLEEALRVAPGASAVLDIGTGSGCLAIALAKRLPNARVTAVDISPDALEVARRNAQRHEAAIEFCEGSLLAPVDGRSFDLIVSNPPYIPTADLQELQPEVRDFEPQLALDGGPDGLDCYRKLIPEAKAHLSSGGWLLVEVGAGQAESVRQLFASAGFSAMFTTKDAGGIERVVGGTIERG